MVLVGYNPGGMVPGGGVCSRGGLMFSSPNGQTPENITFPQPHFSGCNNVLYIV